MMSQVNVIIQEWQISAKVSTLSHSLRIVRDILHFQTITPILKQAPLLEQISSNEVAFLHT